MFLKSSSHETIVCNIFIKKSFLGSWVLTFTAGRLSVVNFITESTSEVILDIGESSSVSNQDRVFEPPPFLETHWKNQTR
jgi:hypothetical protein